MKQTILLDGKLGDTQDTACVERLSRKASGPTLDISAPGRCEGKVAVHAKMRWVCIPQARVTIIKLNRALQPSEKGGIPDTHRSGVGSGLFVAEVLEEVKKRAHVH